MPLLVVGVGKLSGLIELILQIGDQFQSFGHTGIAERLLEVKQAQGPLGCRVAVVPLAPVVFPAKNCPLGHAQQERERSLRQFQFMTKKPDFSTGEPFPGRHQPPPDCAVQPLDVMDFQASIRQFAAVDEVDVVKSAFRIVVCLGHHIFLADDGNNRAFAEIQRNDHLNLSSSRVALQFDPEVAVNVSPGSVSDLSFSQCRQYLAHGNVPFAQPLAEVRLVAVDLAPVETLYDAARAIPGIAERVVKGDYHGHIPVKMSGWRLVNGRRNTTDRQLSFAPFALHSWWTTAADVSRLLLPASSG